MVGDLPGRRPRRSVVRSLSTMHMMGFTPLGFFETVSEGDNLVEGHMSLPTGQLDSQMCGLLLVLLTRPVGKRRACTSLWLQQTRRPVCFTHYR